MTPSQRTRARQLVLESQGLCMRCGKEPKSDTCKLCVRCRQNQSISARKYRGHTQAEARSRARRWYHANPEKMVAKRRTDKFTRYGMSESEYDDLFARQEGKCAICRGVNGNSRSLSVDHDHADGHVRGLLCDRCNLMVGYVESSPFIVESAIAYLKATTAWSLMRKEDPRVCRALVE